MYGFEQVRNLPLMVGSELLQVCIGGNEVILNFFPDGDSVMIYGVDRFVEDNRFMFEQLLGSYPRIRQIGKKVVRFTVKSNEVAYMTMSDGSEIVLKDDSAEFEAVTFHHRERVVIV